MGITDSYDSATPGSALYTIIIIALGGQTDINADKNFSSNFSGTVSDDSRNDLIDRYDTIRIYCLILGGSSAIFEKRHRAYNSHKFLSMIPTQRQNDL